MLVVCRNAAAAFDLADKAGRGRGAAQVRCMPARQVRLPGGTNVLIPLRWLVTVRGLTIRQEQRLLREAGLDSD